LGTRAKRNGSRLEGKKKGKNKRGPVRKKRPESTGLEEVLSGGGRRRRPKKYSTKPKKKKRRNRSEARTNIWREKALIVGVTQRQRESPRNRKEKKQSVGARTGKWEN